MLLPQLSRTYTYEDLQQGREGRGMGGGQRTLVGQILPIFPFFPFLLYVEQWAGREDKVLMGTGLGAR